jgi:hypothetical protein
MTMHLPPPSVALFVPMEPHLPIALARMLETGSKIPIERPPWRMSPEGSRAARVLLASSVAGGMS